VKLTATGVLALAALAAVGILAWRFSPDLKKVVTETLNPASRENIVNKPISAAVSAAVGREESLGGWLAEWLNPATRKVAEMLQGPTSARVKPVLAPSRDPGYSDLYG
jgi:hypothetical protein